MNRQTHRVPTDGGWSLALTRFVDPAAHDRRLRPVLMVPGYAMNSFILSYHPRGPSMIAALCAAGREVWTADLRGQGDSRGPTAGFGMAELALDDLPRAIAAVRAHTAGDARGVDAIGCSLGGSLLFALLAHRGADCGVRALVDIGGPLRWDAAHPLLRVAFRSRRLAGAVPIRGTRRLAAAALPLLARAPGLLSLYLNPDGVDLSAAPQLVRTVEDPIPAINREVAAWLRAGDLVLRGRSTVEGLRGQSLPVLLLLANRDGIVPPPAVLSARDPLPHADVLTVGTDARWYAHADLFVGNHAADEVFAPLAAWLARAAQG
jgi:pimeloyl-ACP methyl ester carboxylesterase